MKIKIFKSDLKIFFPFLYQIFNSFPSPNPFSFINKKYLKYFERKNNNIKKKIIKFIIKYMWIVN
jgi:hypothetical protein